ncbi:MAG TPA: hypothetical protein PLF22_10800 [Pseudomonadales bacterium]|nr:hypothetical protein [Pseudomonadales bacterium]
MAFISRRTLAFLCLAVLSAFWLSAAGVGTNVPSAEDQAETLESSLKAIEWYTNESVRKALQAESAGDVANAKLFGNKAIESDQKAKDLRSQTAAAWVKAGKPARANAAWLRAASMATERAQLLGNRVQPLLKQWKEAQAQSDEAVKRDKEIIYLQGVFVYAQQWALAAEFFESAGEKAMAADAWAEVDKLLPVMLNNNRMQVFAGDGRLAGDSLRIESWKKHQPFTMKK